jgi:uncharacterized membrane protein
MSTIEIKEDLSDANKTLPAIAWGSCLIGMWPVGLVIAYIDRKKTSATYATHYRYLIRTIWIGLFFMIVSSVLSLILIGYITFFATAIWFLIRCVKGLVLVLRDEPIQKPTTWLI